MAIRIIVRRTIDVDESGVFSRIGEIRAGLIGLVEILCPLRKAEGVGFKKIEKLTLQIGVTEALQFFEVLCSWNLHGRSDDVRIPELNEKVLYQVSVERWVIGLIVVTEQAIVTGDLAVFLGMLCFSEVSAGLGVEVAKVKGSRRHL